MGLVSFLAYRVEIAFPGTPDINNTLTPLTQPAPQEIGSYDVLGYPVSYAYWVNEQAGFTPQDQNTLIQFLLSLDDDPAVLPAPSR